MWRWLNDDDKNGERKDMSWWHKMKHAGDKLKDAGNKLKDAGDKAKKKLKKLHVKKILKKASEITGVEGTPLSLDSIESEIDRAVNPEPIESAKGAAETGLETSEEVIKDGAVEPE